MAKISLQVIAPDLETIRSAAAYAKSIECKNLHNAKTKSDLKKKKNKAFVNKAVNKKVKPNNHHISNLAAKIAIN